MWVRVGFKSGLGWIHYEKKEGKREEKKKGKEKKGRDTVVRWWNRLDEVTPCWLVVTTTATDR